jgi:hypothetical protein
VNIAVQLEPFAGSLPTVAYRWDADTDILTAHLDGSVAGEGLSGSVELTGTDGSWLILDVEGGRIHGLEVAVWPDVRKRASLVPPAAVDDAAVTIPGGSTENGVAALEVEVPLLAEADDAERVIYFRVGDTRAARTIRLGSDLLLDLDRQQRLAGLWLLNVPPFPSS